MIISSETFAFPSLFAGMICPEKTIIWQEVTELQRIFHQLPAKIWYNLSARLFMRKVAAFAPFSKQAQTLLSQYFKQVYEVVNHGVNLDKFKYGTEKKRQLISAALLIPRKNIEGIINKFAKLVKISGYEDVILYIAGRGELKEQLEWQVNEMKLTDNVIFLGFLGHEKLNQYIRESYAFLVNTRHDLNMHSIREALASCTPVITNLVPTSADYIAENQLGIAKADWDETDLKTVIDNSSFYIDNCLAYREKLSCTYSVKKLLEIFNKATSAKNK